MKSKYIISSIFFTFNNTVFAHTDAAMGDGAHHDFYHLLFWASCAAVAITIFRWIPDIDR